MWWYYTIPCLRGISALAFMFPPCWNIYTNWTRHKTDLACDIRDNCWTHVYTISLEIYSIIGYTLIYKSIVWICVDNSFWVLHFSQAVAEKLKLTQSIYGTSGPRWFFTSLMIVFHLFLPPESPFYPLIVWRLLSTWSFKQTRGLPGVFFLWVCSLLGRWGCFFLS